MKTPESAVRPQEFIVRLLTAALEPVALEDAYSNYLREVLTAPLWSTTQASGLRIPWRSAKAASGHPLLLDTFGSAGLYLFGSDAGVPLYLGKTSKQTLWKRLRGRYVSGKRSQCQLAADYEHELLARGIGGFPEEVRAWYRRSFRGSTVRLQGAVAFAKHGVEGIWFTLIPMKDPTSVDSLEQRLIPVANTWNQTHGYPALLNFHYKTT